MAVGARLETDTGKFRADWLGGQPDIRNGRSLEPQSHPRRTDGNRRVGAWAARRRVLGMGAVYPIRAIMDALRGRVRAIERDVRPRHGHPMLRAAGKPVLAGRLVGTGTVSFAPKDAGPVMRETQCP